ncbi:MAG TPA: SCE4755 family polysaccharide monooxygenase-like protein [Archangium sp.]
MRPVLLVLLSLPAFAHINLEAPDNFQLVSGLGDPQKSEPCGGAGTASNIVTTVTAGSQLTVRWRETILHPGHFRIGIAENPSQFVTPVPVLNQGGSNCASAPIEMNPSAPIIVDGLFPHTSAAPNNTWSTTITVPMKSCENCTLQLMQFMSAHAPPCFYYQCARLRIVMPDAGTPVVDAGTSDAGLVSDAGVVDAGMISAPTDAGQDEHMHPEAPMGCGCSSAPGLIAVGLMAMVWRRRRAR